VHLLQLLVLWFPRRADRTGITATIPIIRSRPGRARYRAINASRWQEDFLTLRISCQATGHIFISIVIVFGVFFRDPRNFFGRRYGCRDGSHLARGR
jgi:hypothetical protein